MNEIVKHEPWKDEEDEVRSEHMYITRTDTGSLCGYVGVPSNHPWFEKEYNGYVPYPLGFLEQDFDLDKISTIGLLCIDKKRFDEGECTIDLLINVHGGLSYSGGAYWAKAGSPEEDLWWFGFDCGHAWDYQPYLYAELRMQFPGDTMWEKGDRVYRDMDFVKQECINLAKQLVGVMGHEKRTNG